MGQSPHQLLSWSFLTDSKLFRALGLWDLLQGGWGHRCNILLCIATLTCWLTNILHFVVFGRGGNILCHGEGGVGEGESLGELLHWAW